MYCYKLECILNEYDNLIQIRINNIPDATITCGFCSNPRKLKDITSEKSIKVRVKA